MQTLAPPSAPDRGLFHCAWKDTVFLHYEVDPSALRVPFELDLHHGKAYVSVVTITIRTLAAQSFLNVRTYVKGGLPPRGAGPEMREGGIAFLAGWLPNPVCALLGPRVVGIPYRLARMNVGSTVAEVHARARAAGRTFEFRAAIDPRQTYRAPAPGSLDEFLLERYTAFMRVGRRIQTFRVWHGPWRFVTIEPEILDDRLLRASGTWHRGARLVAAHHSPGFEKVGMGRLERVRA